MRNPRGGVLEEESWRRNPRRGMYPTGILEEEFWNRNPRGGILEDEIQRRNPGRGTLEEVSLMRNSKGILEETLEEES